MLTVKEFATARSISLKLSGLLQRLTQLEPSAPSNDRQGLNDQITELHEKLVKTLPNDAQDDRILMALILAPPKGLFINAQREQVTLVQLEGWIAEMDNGETQQIKDLAELRLEFYFGTGTALDRFLELHNQLLKARSMTGSPFGSGEKPRLKR